MSPAAPEPLEHGPAAVVLAAGRGERMGRTKATLPWGGRTILDTWVARLRAAGVREVVAVLGLDGPLVASSLDRTTVVGLVPNPEAERCGLRESLLLGLDALASPGPFLFTPVDVPPPDPAVLTALLAAFSDGAEEPFAVRPCFQGRPGHPVAVGSAFVQRLYEGEPGDRIDELLSWATRRVRDVPVEDPRVLADLDSPEDYLHALRAGWEVDGPVAVADPEATLRRPRRP